MSHLQPAIDLLHSHRIDSGAPMLYNEEVAMVLRAGPPLAGMLQPENPDIAQSLRTRLQQLNIDWESWRYLDCVDTVLQVQYMFETIESLRSDVKLHGSRFQYFSDGLFPPKLAVPGQLDRLVPIMSTIETHQDLRNKATRLRGSDAIKFMDRLTETLDTYPSCTESCDMIKLLQRVVEASEQLPTHLWIAGVTNMTYYDGGGQADIYRCRYRDKDVAARVIRIGPDTKPEAQKKTKSLVRREIIAHRQLHHPNVLELLGIIKDGRYPLSIITQWMENGTASSYLEARPEDFMPIVQGIVTGVSYLHSRKPPIVHGDIKPSNILIDQYGKPVLSDFGVARIRHELSRTGTRSTGSGTFRYSAPELFSCHVIRNDVATDIYACSLTILELATGKWPFPRAANDHQLFKLVLAGERPEMPTSMGPFPIDSEAAKTIWNVLGRMWDQEPTKRPPMAIVKTRLDTIMEDGSIVPLSTSLEMESGISDTITPASDTVTAQEASKKHGNSLGLLIDTLGCALNIAERSQAQDTRKFATSLTSIARQAFSACRLLLDCVPSDGSALPSSPTPRDLRYATALASGLPVLSRMLRLTNSMDLGPLKATSTTETALETIAAYTTELAEHLEQVKGVDNSEDSMDRFESTVSFLKGAGIPLLDINAGEGPGVTMDVGPRTHDAGGASPSTVKLPPDDREALPSASSLLLPSRNVVGESTVVYSSHSRRNGNSAVRLDNKCRVNHWAIDWIDFKDKDAVLSSRWTSTANINGRPYAWGVGLKKGHARDNAAEKVLEMFGEDSIAKLDELASRLTYLLEWNDVPGVGPNTALV